MSRIFGGSQGELRHLHGNGGVIQHKLQKQLGLPA
jgi:hypothetical protein